MILRLDICCRFHLPVCKIVGIFLHDMGPPRFHLTGCRPKCFSTLLIALGLKTLPPRRDVGSLSAKALIRIYENARRLNGNAF